MTIFSGIPFFRILLPFVAGIVAALTACSQPELAYWWLLPVCVASLFLSRISKLWMLSLADLCLFAYGFLLVNYTDVRWDAAFYKKVINTDSAFYAVAVVHEVPVKKENALKCELKLLQAGQGKISKQISGRVIAYFKYPVKVELAAGSLLLVKLKLNEVPAPLNPYEFDYKAYLRNKQIHHLAFVAPGAFRVLRPGEGMNPLVMAGLRCKQWVVTRLNEGGLSHEAYGICCALLTGYDDGIDRTVMDAFAHSGTLHVLSVSGLHTGLIYLVIGFLFDLTDRHKKRKLLKFVTVTVILWFFALLTGFSAPVLRAVVMFNLFGIGNIYFRNDQRNQLNILLVSAFLLLSYNPFYITDVGFLLSYFALAGLICFQPGFAGVWRPSGWLPGHVWQSVTASLAATVGTLPLTLFYFKQFPCWFFICNLVVVPATFLLLLLAVLLVFKLSVAAMPINFTTKVMIAFIGLFNSEGIGFVDAIHFTGFDVFYSVMFIVLFAFAITRRTYRLACATLLVLLCWQFTSLYESYAAKQQSGLLIYQVNKKDLIAVKNKDRLRFSSMDSADYNFHVRPHVTHMSYPEITIRKFNCIITHAEHVLLLDEPGSLPAGDLPSVTKIVLSNDFALGEPALRQFKKLNTLVADGSNNSRSVKKAQELSRKFGLKFYCTKQLGAYILPLQ